MSYPASVSGSRRTDRRVHKTSDGSDQQGHGISGRCLYLIPCDSIEAWIVAAFDKVINAEMIENPWENVVSKKKNYHDIRVRSGSKNQRAFAEFAGIVCENWSDVTRICETARIFETDIQRLTAQPLQQ